MTITQLDHSLHVLSQLVQHLDLGPVKVHLLASVPLVELGNLGSSKRPRFLVSGDLLHEIFDEVDLVFRKFAD